MTFIDWLWNNRTKVIGYVGASIAQIGISGLVSQKVAAVCALIASLITIGIGHFNDYKARQAAQETP
jgi:hypothetical protein